MGGRMASANTAIASAAKRESPGNRVVSNIRYERRAVRRAATGQDYS